MGTQQILLAGQGLIVPPYAVGALLFSDTGGPTAFPGNGSNYLVHDETFTIPGNWQTKNYEYRMDWTCDASYVCFAPTTQVYKNGVLQISWSEPGNSNSWFRYNSGTRSHTHNLDLAAGDVFRAIMYGRGRNVGGSTPPATLYHQLKRAT